MPRRDGPRRGFSRRGIRARRGARRKAVDILYQADVMGRFPLKVLEELKELEDIPEYAEEIVRGVSRHLHDIDNLIGMHAEGWTVPRMAVVDRNLLRVALYEILFREDIPIPVAIDEAVEAAKALSTEDSGRFVNGILGRIVREDVPEEQPEPEEG